MAATLIQSPDRVVLQNISWQRYQSLIRDLGQEPAIRLTYDQGAFEIRMPLEELDLEIRSLGFCNRENLESGVELTSVTTFNKMTK